ncbi:hypothetical protein ACFO1B_41250 [Dactylosporangium siamense]|uniref:Uncharacterized protein n=1 Tax=Dactylosporangium siamense TaxID=685454 RepID=A0A919U5T0_9ACTN|nr:hypothetical protein [Dactylosporangium siamense]GIG42687.1 hypothetical protein Dsi01nite_007280 [Dactylosporangium siamense]
MPRRSPTAADEVRGLARLGTLATTVANADEPQRLRLTGGAYSVVYPVVYTGLTQGLERRRGHPACAVSVRHLADDCLDRFHDDVEAVVHDVVRRATAPIDNLDAWICGLINSATVNGHRRRRGEIGALQRPRAPKWLVDGLGGDRWLVHLAVQMLNWVGNPATAGSQVWPVDSWTALRCRFTGDWDPAADVDVRHDIEAVLRVMRAKREWYERYVEGPLGHKHVPVPRFAPESPGTLAPALDLLDVGERDDLYMRELAHLAMTAMRTRLLAGEDPRTVVAEVINVAFGDGAGLAMDGTQHVSDATGEHVGRLLRDQDRISRIVVAVLAVVEDR